MGVVAFAGFETELGLRCPNLDPMSPKRESLRDLRLLLRDRGLKKIK